MAKELHHPSAEQIDLSNVLDALSDPIRRGIVVRLADGLVGPCSSFHESASKTNLTYHLARLREAGIIQVRIDGAYRHISLRKADLDLRFPGLLDAILASARDRSRTAQPA